MKIFIDRYIPEINKTRTDTFEVDKSELKGKTVMSLLNYLSKEQDCTLAYYHHSVCDHGICGRCSVMLNGKVCLSCITPIEELDEIYIAPVASRTPVRDLVTK